MMRYVLLLSLSALPCPSVGENNVAQCRAPEKINDVTQDLKNQQPSSYKLRKIKQITVTHASLRNGYNPQEKCNDFKMTAARSRFLFRHAVAVSNRAFWHDYVYTSCYATGKIRFANGDEGEWTIYRYGRGTIEILRGPSKGEFIQMFCQKCEDADS